MAEEQKRLPVAGFRVALVLLSFGFGASLLECGLRLADRHVYRDEQQDWTLRIRMHHAGKDSPVDASRLPFASGNPRVRTDGRGYLLPSRRFDNPDATIAFIGGSTTECAALEEDDRYPAVVSRLLEERGLRVNTLNAGRSGNTSHDAVNILFNHVAQDAPDVVVLMEAANDVGVISRDPTYRTRSDSPITAIDTGRWAIGTLSTYSALVGAFRFWQSNLSEQKLRGAAVALNEPTTPSTVPFEQRLRAFVGVARAFGIYPVLMTQPSSRTRTELSPEWARSDLQALFNDVVRLVAADEQVAIVDLARKLRETVVGWDQPMQVFYDGIHVTDRGARLYAEFITQQLLESVPLLRTPPVDAPAASRSR